ncbi:MAG: DUF502 domain-containing protein [Bacteroidales bacterium]|nr:DUF502 domain-containing protein [Bacteroidales bacterium]
MNIHLFRRIRNFLRITLLGGLAAILPLALVFIVLRWIFNLIYKYLDPIASLVTTNSKIHQILVYVVIIAGILLIFFLLGLAIKTRIGRFFNRVLEEKYLIKIPGYKIAKDTVQQFFGKNKSFFSEVVLVDVFNCGTLMTGFITDEFGDYLTVFIPTGPNPTSGNIYHVKKDKVIRTSTPIESGMKSIISCGAGSNEIFSNTDKQNN